MCYGVNGVNRYYITILQHKHVYHTVTHICLIMKQNLLSGILIKYNLSFLHLSASPSMEGDAYKDRKEDNMVVQIASWQYIDALCTSGTNYEAFILGTSYL